MPFDITAVVPDVSYSATGGQVAFTVPFGFFANTDLLVTDNSALQALTTDYTVTGAGITGGGTVTFVAGRTAGHIIRIRRLTAVVRTSAYVTGGALPANALETDLDKLTCMLQEIGYATGNFNVAPGAWVGFVTGLNVDFEYRIVGGIVTVTTADTNLLASISNSAGFSIASGQWPAALRPRATRTAPCIDLYNSGTAVTGSATIATDGAVAFNKYNPTGGSLIEEVSGWTASGMKGLRLTTQLVYPL